MNSGAYVSRSRRYLDVDQVPISMRVTVSEVLRPPCDGLPGGTSSSILRVPSGNIGRIISRAKYGNMSCPLPQQLEPYPSSRSAFLVPLVSFQRPSNSHTPPTELEAYPQNHRHPHHPLHPDCIRLLRSQQRFEIDRGCHDGL